MKVVVNRCFGGFGISEEAKKILDTDFNWLIERTDEQLIALIEEKGSEFCSGYCAELEVVEIPENATDWEISEYDGFEEIIYVVDGKIKHF